MGRNMGGSMDRSLNDGPMGGQAGPSNSGMGGSGGFGGVVASSGGWAGAAGQQGGGSLQAKSDKVVVRGLAETCTWHTLKDRFSHAGDIKFAEMKERGVGVIRWVESLLTGHTTRQVRDGAGCGARCRDDERTEDRRATGPRGALPLVELYVSQPGRSGHVYT
jgi:hypothetical protein